MAVQSEGSRSGNGITPNSPPDYSKVFDYLCHVLALTQRGKTRAVVDNLVLTIFVIQPNLAPKTAGEIASAIAAKFGLTLSANVIQSTLDHHLRDGKILKDRKTGILLIAQHDKGAVETRIAAATKLEQEVRSEWFKALISSYHIQENDLTQYWECLRLYMAKVFRRHGAETIQLLRPSIPNTENDARGLSAYLAEAIRESGVGIEEKQASEAIGSFFLQSTHERTQYLSQLLDGTFSFFALSIDDDIASYLRHDLPRLMLFLDTNFVFGIIGINSGPISDVSLELLQLIKIHDLPFTLYCHEDTLLEIDRTIHHFGARLKAHRWEPQLSRAALQEVELTDLEIQYHTRNSESAIDPDVFMTPYEHIRELLKERGVREYPARKYTPEQMLEKGSLIAEYDEYVKENRPARPKPQGTLNHDISLWLAVNDLRKTSNNVLDTGALILSNDGFFQKFTWQRLRQQNRASAVVLPNQLMQLLRPFIPVTEDFNRRFIETFAIPEFRTGTDFSEIPSRVLAYLSRFEGMSEETAVHILSDEVAKAHLRSIQPDSEKFGAALDTVVNQHLLNENTVLEVQHERTKAMLSEQETQLRENREQLDKKKHDHDMTQAALTTMHNRLDDVVEEGKKRDRKQAAEMERISNENANRAKEIEDLRADREMADQRARIIARIAIAVIVGIAGITGILLFGAYASWEFLQQHPHRIQLLIAACAIWSGVIWGAFETDKTRRGFVFGVVARQRVFDR